MPEKKNKIPLRRFKSLEHLKHYWRDGTDAPHIDTLVFLSEQIERLQDSVNKLNADIEDLYNLQDHPLDL